MKNKGYTLLELLGVMVLLAILITLVFPSIINFIKTSNEKHKKLVNDLIVNATKSYINDNKNEYSPIYGNTYCISLDTLIGLEYLDDNVINKENNDVVKVDYKGSFNYEVVSNNSCLGVSVKLESNLIPVIYDGNNWIVVDSSKEKWFDYDNQEWANVVILDSDVRKKVGDIVIVDGESPEALAMLVWIPRFSYTIGNTYGVQLEGGSAPSSATPGAIDIKFIDTNTKEMGTASYTGDTPSNFRTHPAFTFGSDELSGIWVGKFELSHATLSSRTTANNLGCSNEECESSDGLRILPNVQSLRYNNVSNFFFGIRSMSKEGNVFGIDKNIIDTHMIKNNEWGAVAYLSQSKYGKYGNSAYSVQDKEVYINNSSLYYTGRSGGSYGGNTAENTVYDVETDAQYVNVGYYTYDGYLLEYNSNTKTEAGTRDMTKVASTTGNIYGVYDMSGGSWEYVMGVFANSNGDLWSGNSADYNSGFKGNVGADEDNIEGLEWPNTKYYSVYMAISDVTIDRTKACNGTICYGDALTETANWYGDYASFVSATYTWFVRGGGCSSGSNAGVFSSHDYNGHVNGDASARVVLTPIFKK